MSIVAKASSISRRSAAVSWTSAAGRLSSRCSIFVPPGIGTIHGFWASSQANAICAGVIFLRAARFLQKVDHLEVGFQRFGREAGKILAQIIRVIELHVLGDLAGEKALAERSPSDETDAELFAQRKLCPLGFAHPQGVMVLDRGHRLHGMRLADVLGAGLRQAEMLDLAFRDELLDRACDVFHRHSRIDAVLVEQVDMVGPQPLQRSFHHLADMLGPAVEPDDLALSSILKPNFVQTRTWSRTGSSASPTSSSLTNGP